MARVRTIIVHKHTGEDVYGRHVTSYVKQMANIGELETMHFGICGNGIRLRRHCYITTYYHLSYHHMSVNI